MLATQLKVVSRTCIEASVERSMVGLGQMQGCDEGVLDDDEPKFETPHDFCLDYVIKLSEFAALGLISSPTSKTRLSISMP